MKYDHVEIANLRQTKPWGDVISLLGLDCTEKQISDAHYRWRKSQSVSMDPEDVGTEGFLQSRTISAKKFSGVRSLEDLVKFFDVDLDRWEVKSFKVGGSEWDQSVSKGHVAQSIRIDAYFVRKLEAEVRDVEDQIQAFIKDAADHAPEYETPERPDFLSDEEDPCLFELALYDPHFGMLASRSEVGHAYDLPTAVQDYAVAVEHLLGYARLYPTERILYVVGNDFLHVDSEAFAFSGGGKGGATTAGTMQDIDTRLAKMFTEGRRALVRGIDKARLIAPVDVVVVPGNHDRNQMYRMGEVLSAWYRKDDEVDVIYSPNKRHYYGYGKNAIMLTHGEEYKRKRDSLPLIFSTECDPHVWINSAEGCREVHTGHNHIGLAGGYYPTADLDETRGIRTRALSGMTPEDAWHHEQGYKHHRAATALVFRKSGGVAGIHEFSL